MHQAFTRAYVKLCFAFGLGHLIANTIGVVRFDHIQEKLGQIWNMVELTRSALVAAEAGSCLDEGGVWYPDDRPFLALRGEMPKWLPRANELLQLIGGGGFMCHPVARPTWTGRCARCIDKLLPGGRGRRRAADPALPARLGLHRLRPRRPRRAVRALLPLGLLADDGARLQDRGQVVRRVARRAVPPRLMLRGYSLPRSPEGRSRLVPAPPWHYVGDFLVIEYWADAGRGRGGAAAGPRAASRTRAAARRSSSTGSRARTPAWSWSIRSAASTRSSSSSSTRCWTAEHVTTCPYIWVDKDFALARGWIQGFPKKLGSIHMTRALRARLERRAGAGGRRPLRRHARRERPPPRRSER